MVARSGPRSLKAQAIAHLARREFGRQELRERLMRRPPRADDNWQPPAAVEVDAALDALEAAGYLSDARAAAQRVASRAPRQGLRRLSQDLARRGLVLPDDERTRLRATEAERARAVWLRRFGAAPATPQERARQWRFLLARGFEAGVVARVVGGPGAPDDGEALAPPFDRDDRDGFDGPDGPDGAPPDAA